MYNNFFEVWSLLTLDDFNVKIITFYLIHPFHCFIPFYFFLCFNFSSNYMLTLCNLLNFPSTFDSLFLILLLFSLFIFISTIRNIFFSSLLFVHLHISSVTWRVFIWLLKSLVLKETLKQLPPTASKRCSNNNSCSSSSMKSKIKSIVRNIYKFFCLVTLINHFKNSRELQYHEVVGSGGGGASDDGGGAVVATVRKTRMHFIKVKMKIQPFNSIK